MKARWFPVLGIVVVTCSVLPCALRGQEPPAADLPPVPQGVEVQARGPVHEAFATPTTEPVPTQAVAKCPPRPLDEQPPEEKPEGNVVWIGGYWAWDDDRKDYLWVSGIWRTAPPGKQWVAGYWRADGGNWQWVPGFWTAAAAQEAVNQQVTYLPAPPAPPTMADPGAPPTPDSFYVPGTWAWDDGRYVWRAGYWGRVQTGYVWVAAHYRWTPSGYIYIPGYWDLAIARRGVLFAPVYVDVAIVGPRFVYRPAYVVPEAVVIDAFFVRPCFCHYYFGDYYGPVYRSYGFESCVVYSRRCYDPIFVYARWEHRDNPGWINIQVNLYRDRYAGRAPLPPRILVERNGTVHNHPGLMPFRQYAAARRINTVAINAQTRASMREQSLAIQRGATARGRMESSMVGSPTKPHVAALPAARLQPVNAGLSGRAGTPGGPGPNHTSPALAGPGSGPASRVIQPGPANPAPHLSGPPHLTGPSAPVGPRPALGGNGLSSPRPGTGLLGPHAPTTGPHPPLRPPVRPAPNRPQPHGNATEKKDH